MKPKQDWKICLEIGLNHNGKIEEILKIIEQIEKKNVAITLQIREDDFYLGANRKFNLSQKQYKRISNLCSKLNIPLGIAIGVISKEKIKILKSVNFDFLKLLYMTIKDHNFIKDINKQFNCPKYFSLGMTSFLEAKNDILPLMKKTDKFVYTSLSHDPKDQYLKAISELSSLKKDVCFGHHCSKEEVIFTAIGAGAKKIFTYVGDKKKKIPDLEHAIDIKHIKSFLHKCNNSFDAVQIKKNNKKVSKISFIKSP